MKITKEKTELEQKLEKARDGYASLAETMAPFALRDQSLQRNEVILRYQRGLDLFAEVRRTQEEQKLAVEKLRSALPGMKQFHGEALLVARKHFGADAKTMSMFGVKCPERGARRRRGCRSGRGGEVITEVVQEVIVEEEVVSREAPPPKRGCRPSRRPERLPKRGCEEAKGCGGKATKRDR